MSVRASSAPQGSLRLTERRLRRRRLLAGSGILLCVFLAALEYGLWQSPVRVSRIVIYGADQSLADVARSALAGSYFGIVPRDSTFFISDSRVRASLLSARSDIAAISLFRNGLTGLSVKVDYRVPIARWCGPSFASSTPESKCYLFDASGFVYATATEPFVVQAGAATSSAAVAPADEGTVTPFVLFDALKQDSPAPVGSTIIAEDTLPAVFDFARRLASFGSPVSIISIRGDEADIYLANGARVTYVVGSEEDALSALTSAGANLNLADGSIDYIDLRFPGKVYVKKKE